MFYNILDDTKLNDVICRNTAKVVKLEVHVLQLLNVSHNIMSLLRNMKLMSHDKSVDLTGVLSYHATLFECLRYNHLSLQQVRLM